MNNANVTQDEEQLTLGQEEAQTGREQQTSEEMQVQAGLATIEHAHMLEKQDQAIADRINQGASLDEAIDVSNSEFGPSAHPEQVQMRVAKRALMLKNGMNPYPVKLDITTSIADLRSRYTGSDGALTLEKGQETDEVVGLAGRVLFLRNGGGLCFVQLSSGDGARIQGMISRKVVGPDSLKQYKQLVDLGDHLYIHGKVISSNTGELSVMVDSWQIASKALQPLPALHKELSEEQRTRKPYLGMIVDSKARDMVRNRAKVVSSLRRNFDERGYLEAETPMLQTNHGGATARPFETHMNAFDINLFMRIAPELFLKRLLVGGIDKVFEINRDFRNEGADGTHAPEFTMVEAYEAYGTYDTMAELTRSLVQQAALDAFGTTELTLADGTPYNVGGEWTSITMYGSLSEKLGEEITPETSVDYLASLADKLGVERDEVENHGKLVEHLWEHFYTEDPHTLWEPTFVRDFPVETSPLTKSHRSVAGQVEKWDLYVRGFELATAYSELNDPVVQRQRFVDQARMALAGDAEAMDIDEDFLEALGVGMPPAGGMGMGIDRLLIALTGATIRETITFPLVKPLNLA
ncbi:lysyl-tRNA synthetase [Scardovia inopinata]|uniref:Lysine--tRNA ligase n=2 Tax=Scardovia inopinata TaxID=78259 RepID=W5IIK9_SCAIO|nr:lysine-tRNA ligase [Scardovia inopinata F0304]BAR06467.1 lysyl-tRNA synthase [Scardovia inopinata JCM 12537]SUV51983.1 lysyl-tRNA synthetase [Scardovia inopinata]